MRLEVEWLVIKWSLGKMLMISEYLAQLVFGARASGLRISKMKCFRRK